MAEGGEAAARGDAGGAAECSSGSAGAAAAVGGSDERQPASGEASPAPQQQQQPPPPPPHPPPLGSESDSGDARPLPQPRGGAIQVTLMTRYEMTLRGRRVTVEDVAAGVGWVRRFLACCCCFFLLLLPLAPVCLLCVFFVNTPFDVPPHSSLCVSMC